MHWGRVLSFTRPYIGKTGPYGPPMSVCANVMSEGVHNIAFSVTPDMCTASNSPELSRIIHMTLIRVAPTTLMDMRVVHTKYGNHTYRNVL